MEWPFSSFLITPAIPKSHIFGCGIVSGALSVTKMFSGWGGGF